MGRNRQQSVFDITFDLLKMSPMWGGPVLALIVFVLFRFVLPLFISDKPGAPAAMFPFRPLFVSASWLFAGAVLFLWLAAEIWKLFNRRLLDGQTGLPSIRNIHWQDFERLVSEAYRRRGYLAQVVDSPSGDGGVDIQLTGHGETVLVQCKQWRAYSVGAPVVRELLGVVVSERADRGIVVTSGRFTQEAIAFAERNPQLELVDGPQLAELIRAVQAAPQIAPPQAPKPSPVSTAPPCPRCGVAMVLRTARQGPNAGSQFWGCPKYPACSAIRQMAASNLA